MLTLRRNAYNDEKIKHRLKSFNFNDYIVEFETHFKVGDNPLCESISVLGNLKKSC